MTNTNKEELSLTSTVNAIKKQAMPYILSSVFWACVAGAGALTTGTHYLLNTTDGAERRALERATRHAQDEIKREKQTCWKNASITVGDQLLNFQHSSVTYLQEKGWAARTQCDATAEQAFKNMIITPETPSPFLPFLFLSAAAGLGTFSLAKRKPRTPDPKELKPM